MRLFIKVNKTVFVQDVDVSKYDLLDDSTEEKEKEENPVEKLRY